MPDMKEMIAIAPGLGITKRIGRPFSAAEAVLLFHSGAIAISSRSSIWVRMAGERAALASSSRSFSQPGSSAFSEPPNVLAAIASVARPRFDEVRAMPILPRNSGFQRSAQDSGGLRIICVL
jgi:hypothetical protein